MAELMPCRIQLRRLKGWRMPPNTLKVDRTTRWGNQFRPDEYKDAADNLPLFRHEREEWMCEMAAEAFAEWVRDEATDEWKAEAVRNLRGKNLACWCPLSRYCHADVLLALANKKAPEPQR